MFSRTKFKLEWLIIIFLLLVIIIGSLIVFINKYNSDEVTDKKNNTNTESIDIDSSISKKDIAIKEYEKLEKAYNNTLNDIEKLVGKENMSISILKSNLINILEDIKRQKEKIKLNENDSSININISEKEQLENLLEMSKEVLAYRLLEMEGKNQKLTINNRKLTNNLNKAEIHFEKEQIKNLKLNEIVSNFDTKIKKLENNGLNVDKDIKALKREKKEYEKRLKESDKTIENQKEQLSELGEVLRKVHVDCFFLYEENNPSEEASIYLTSHGLSEKYFKYFIRKKPDIHIKFKINSELFDGGAEKVDLKMYNSRNIEVYNTYKVIRSKNLYIRIPNKGFSQGKYYIKLFTGQENLLVNEKYEFKISK